MLSEAYVSHSVHKGDLPLKGGGVLSPGWVSASGGSASGGICLQGRLPNPPPWY